jgi:mono/diheme cytochrome c family protein
MKSFLFFSAVFLLTIATISAASSSSQEAAPAPAPAATTKIPVKATPESRAHAKKLYEVDCALCHNSNGDGKTDVATGMNLTLLNWTDPKALANKSDQEMFDAIRNGKGKMPPEPEGRAKNDDVWNLVLYIRSLAKEQPATEPGK